MKNFVIFHYSLKITLNILYNKWKKGRRLLHFGTNTVVKGPDETVFTCEF